MSFHRSFLSYRTAKSDSGGIIADGPFTVKLSNFSLLYKEADHRLKISVELLRGNTADYNINVDTIRQWDEPIEPLSRDQVAVIRKNIFAALDHLHIRCSNAR